MEGKLPPPPPLTKNSKPEMAEPEIQDQRNKEPKSPTGADIAKKTRTPTPKPTIPSSSMHNPVITLQQQKQQEEMKKLNNNQEQLMREWKEQQNRILVLEKENQMLRNTSKERESVEQNTRGSEADDALTCETWSEKFKELQNKFDNFARKDEISSMAAALEKFRNEPLHKDILDEEFPKGFNHGTLTKYDETTDPLDHIWQFDSLINEYPRAKRAICRLFKGTLKGGAISWYNNLPKGKIRSWKDLSDAFCKHYCHNKKKEVTRHDLNTMKIRDGETTKEFLSRWMKVYSECNDVNDMEAVTYFGNSLPSNHITAIDLAKLAPRSIEEMVNIVHACARVEEIQRRNPPPMVNTTSSENKRGRVASPSNKRGKQRKEFPKWTQFTVSYEQLLEENEKESFWTPRINNPLIENPASPFCKFHKLKHHSTNGCISLKYFVEDLVKDGHLSKYIVNSAEQGAEGENMDPEKIVNMIAEIRPVPEFSVRSKKAKVNQVNMINSIVHSARIIPQESRGEMVAFSEKDMHYVASPHNDPLVIHVRYKKVFLGKYSR